MKYFMRSVSSIAGIALALMATTVDAQLPSVGDLDAKGRIYTKIIVTIAGESGAFGHPVSDLRFLVVTEDGDRISVRTNDAGVASTWLAPASYRIVNPDPYPWDGKTYTWDTVLAVKPGSALIRLSQANASKVVTIQEFASPIPSTVPVTSVPQLPQNVGQAPGVNSITQGFFLAPHLLGASLKVEDESVESGGGVGLSLGYGISRALGVFFALDFASIAINDSDDNYLLGHGDLGLKLSFRDHTQKAIPYVQAAFSARVTQQTIDGSDVQISGPGLTAGVGLNYYLQPNAGLDIGLSYTAGKFNTLKIDGDDIPISDYNAYGARFQLGLTWFPFR